VAWLRGHGEGGGGHYHVNWQRVHRSKELGGLGILNLISFNRALLVRWKWYEWRDPNKPWLHMTAQTNPTEDALFRACTTIAVGRKQMLEMW
jgi:hypothetical protein